jgi:hypothetical protein
MVLHSHGTFYHYWQGFWQKKNHPPTPSTTYPKQFLGIFGKMKGQLWQV